MTETRMAATGKLPLSCGSFLALLGLVLAVTLGAQGLPASDPHKIGFAPPAEGGIPEGFAVYS
jgi:hypothetical protein